MKLIHQIILILFLLTIHVEMQGQCNGGTGNNLFPEGDFGSGEEYALLEDPMIAPGYQYTRGGPPQDGQYMITNNPREWNMNWDTWLLIQDNSSDPDGYMMVVNASFEPGLFYDEVVENLCENTSFEFSADIINMIRTGVNDHSDPNVDFLIDGERVLGTGNIPKNERWNTYSFVFNTAPGQTSVRLSLRNNAPGGIGNDLALDNITFRACGPMAEINAPQIVSNIFCQEEDPLVLTALIENAQDNTRSYLWEKSEGIAQGTAWEVIDNANSSQLELATENNSSLWVRFATAATDLNLQNENCRFYSEPIFIDIPQRIFEMNDTLCGGTELPFGMGGLARPGLFIQELVSSKGCDSIIMITLDTVERATLSADLSLQSPMCFGKNSGSITGINVEGGYPPYRIEVDGIGFPSLVADKQASGLWPVRILDRYDCFYEGQALLNTPEELVIDIGEDRVLTLGEELNLEVESNIQLAEIIWTESLSSFNGMSNITILPIQNETIAVIGRTADGCEATDEITIDINVEANIYAPNAFSPNNDGINDNYKITAFGRSLDFIEIFEIYDRWGNLIFDNPAGADGVWNGEYKNLRLNAGTYAYRLTAVLINGDKIARSGTLQIIL